MNVCDDGASIITFRDAWSATKDHEGGSPTSADAEWLEHCRAREFAERAAAKNASSIEARRIHQQLAQAYARMIQRAGG